MNRLRAGGGFTLLEILIALGIIAVALMALLEAHQGALRLYERADAQLLQRELMARALALSETEVVAGTYAGEGDFGKRYADYTYHYAAVQVDPDYGFFEMTVTVTGPDGLAHEMAQFVYDMK